MYGIKIGDRIFLRITKKRVPVSYVRGWSVSGKQEVET
jgi:hypothetical protein